MSGNPLIYLSEDDVARALEEVDVVDAVATSLAAHARGEVALPQEAHLRWQHHGERLRSLSMAAAVEGSVGVKVINANPANPKRGLPRASSLILLHDIATGRPACVLEAARISCLRTAAVTAVATQLLGASPIRRLALLGAGAIARCHCELLGERLPHLREVRIYDIDAARAGELAAGVEGAAACSSPEEAIRGAQLVVPVTTTTRQATSASIGSSRDRCWSTSRSTMRCPRSSCGQTSCLSMTSGSLSPTSIGSSAACSGPERSVANRPRKADHEPSTVSSARSWSAREPVASSQPR